MVVVRKGCSLFTDNLTLDATTAASRVPGSATANGPEWGIQPRISAEDAATQARFAMDWCDSRIEELFPFDGDARGGHFEAHHAMAGVQINHNLQIWRTDAHSFVSPVSGLLLAKRLHGNVPGTMSWGITTGNCLFAAGLPVIQLRKHARTGSRDCCPEQRCAVK